MIIALFEIVLFLLRILSMVVIVQVICSWLVAFNVINLHQPFVRAVYTAMRRLWSRSATHSKTLAPPSRAR